MEKTDDELAEEGLHEMCLGMDMFFVLCHWCGFNFATDNCQKERAILAKIAGEFARGEGCKNE